MKMASVDGSKSLQKSSDESFEFECGPCSYDGEKKDAIVYCIECDDYLCSSCKSTHRKLPVTRNHKVVSGSAMPRKSSSNTGPRSQNSFVKCSCNGKDATIYCEEHNEVICVDCQRLKHRTCQTMSIDAACKQVKLPSTERSLKTIQGLKEKVEKLKADRNSDNEELEIQSSECRQKVKEYSQNLKQQIEKLEKATLNEVAIYDTEQRQKIEENIDTCSTAVTKLNLDSQLLNSTPSTESNLLFIHNLQLTKTIEHVENALKDMESEAFKPNIDFKSDTTIIRADTKSLGTVESTGKITPRPVIADMNVKSSRKVEVKNSSDGNDPLISGSVFMPNGELVLCDCINRSAKVLSTDFTSKDQTKLSSMPWDIDIMADDEVVISLPHSKSLIFLKVFPKLQLGSSIQLDQACRGVAVDDGSMFVSFDNGEVRVLDRAGNQLKSIYSSPKLSLPYYISVLKSGKICVSEHGANTIRMLNNGKEMCNYKQSGLSHPLGMYIDGAENVFICGFSSHNVHIIDKNGTHKKVFLTANDGLNCPYSISFRSSDNTLVVGGNMGRNLLVFKLS